MDNVWQLPHRLESDFDVSVPTSESTHKRERIRKRKQPERKKQTSNKNNNCENVQLDAQEQSNECTKPTGLHTHQQYNQHVQEMKKRNQAMLEQIHADHRSGQNADTIVRDAKTGRRMTDREIEEQRKRKHGQDAPMEWGKGLEQSRQREQELSEIKAMKNAPLGRSRDDQEYNERLRQHMHWGDPMAHMLKAQSRNEPPSSNTGTKYKNSVHQRHTNNQSSEKQVGVKQRPYYTGDPWPNRFDIRPGYRWDGRDRSNGFEERYFQSVQKRETKAAEHYKYEHEDL